LVKRPNKLLESVGPELALARPHLREVILRPGQLLCSPGEPIRFVCFPHGGIISRSIMFRDGAEIECALVGREGAIGAMATLGVRVALTRDVNLVEMSASLITRENLEHTRRLSPRFREVLEGYCAREMSSSVLSSACNAHHSLEQRMARWLLTCTDILERPEIPLGQGVPARLLGVQRTSANLVLQRLRSEGLISLGRSRLRILDRQRLLDWACECYDMLRSTADGDLTNGVRGPAGGLNASPSGP
jgi:CRP-like cAMP-binding protein